MLGISDIIDHNCASSTLQTNERKGFSSNMPDCNTFRFRALVIGTGVDEDTGGRRISRIECACRSCKLLDLRPTLKKQVTVGIKNAERSRTIGLNLFDNSVAINISAVTRCKRNSQVAYSCGSIQQISIPGNQLRV